MRIESIKLCVECGSDNKTINYKRQGKYYCWRHYQQMNKYGNTLERTLKDTNDYIYNSDETVSIILRNKEQLEIARCIIDVEKIQELSKHIWGLTVAGYVATSISQTKKKALLIHRLVMGEIDGDLVVDHIDGNPLNNRMSNLRLATSSQNAMNSRISSDNSSGVKGVSFDKSMSKWQAYINIDYKKINLGYFSCLENAAKARKDAEIKYHGEFRRASKDSEERGLN